MTTTAIERTTPPTPAELAERLEAARLELADAERALAEAQTAAAIDATPKALEIEGKARTAHSAANVVVDRLEAALEATTRREAREAHDAQLYSLRVEDAAFTDALDKADKAARALDKALEAYAGAVTGYLSAASEVQQRLAAIGGRARQDHALPILSRELPRQLARATKGAFTLPGAASLVSHDVTEIAPLADDVASHTSSWRGDIERAAAARERASGGSSPPIATDRHTAPAVAAHASATAAPSEARTW